MHIKIGDTIYDGVGYPMMVILTDRDRQNISNMLTDHYRYAQVPEGSDEKEIEAWMDEGMDGIVEQINTWAQWNYGKKAKNTKTSIVYAIGMCHVIRGLIVLPVKTEGLRLDAKQYDRWRRYDKAIHALTIKLLEKKQ